MQVSEISLPLKKLDSYNSYIKAFFLPPVLSYTEVKKIYLAVIHGNIWSLRKENYILQLFAIIFVHCMHVVEKSNCNIKLSFLILLNVTSKILKLLVLNRCFVVLSPPLPPRSIIYPLFFTWKTSNKVQTFIKIIYRIFFSSNKKLRFFKHLVRK